jgi:hypothetical protein
MSAKEVVIDSGGKKTEVRKSLRVFEKNSKGPKSDNHGKGNGD